MVLRMSGTQDDIAHAGDVCPIGVVVALQAECRVLLIRDAGFANDGAVEMPACIKLHVLLGRGNAEYASAGGINDAPRWNQVRLLAWLSLVMQQIHVAVALEYLWDGVAKQARLAEIVALSGDGFKPA